MSVFDIIKYPLSVPPTMEEVSNLPPEMWSILVSETRRIFTMADSSLFLLNGFTLVGFLTTVEENNRTHVETVIQATKKGIAKL